MTIEQLVGQTLGSCQLLQLVGVGGMGAVYRANQLSLDREVAVKIMSPDLLREPTFASRFEQEAKVAASLDHIHIVPVYDYGIEKNSLISYVVMRMLTGGTLDQRVTQIMKTEKALPSLNETARLLQQLGSALDYAHGRGVIHRDIKTSNVMFDTQGNAFLVDFGIAKLTDRDSKITRTQEVIGTPAFISPEQCRSESAITGAADQYSLGIMTYLLVTGRLPFETGTPLAMIHMHLNEHPPSPQALRPDLPVAVSEAVERAIAKNPADRFPTVSAFAQAFAGATDEADDEDTYFFTAPVRVTVPAPPAIVQAKSPIGNPRAKRSVFIAGVFVAVMVLAAVFFFVVLEGDDSDSSDTEPSATVSASNVGDSDNTPTADNEIAVLLTASLTPTITYTPTTPALPLVIDATEAVVSHTPTLTLPTTIPPATQVWLDLSATAHLWTPTETFTPTATSTPSHTPDKTRTHTPTSTLPPSLTSTSIPSSTPMPTSTLTLTPTNTPVPPQRITAANMDGLTEIAWKNVRGGDVQVAWSPDGNRLAVTTANGIALYAPDNLEDELQSLQEHGMVRGLAFSPDGTTLAYGAGGFDVQGVRLWNIRTGAQNTLLGHINEVSRVAFSPDGTRLASGSWDGTMRLWDTTTGEELAFWFTDTDQVQPVAFSPDGAYLAMPGEGFEGEVRIYHIPTGELATSINTQGVAVNCLAFSPDGNLLVLGDTYDSTVKLWDAHMGEPIVILVGHTGQAAEGGVYSVAFSPDSQLLATGGMDKTIRIWDVAASSPTFGQELTILKRHTGVVSSLAFSPNGTMLASGGGSGDATVRLWAIAP